MKLPSLDMHDSFAPALEQLLAERQTTEPQPLSRRDRTSETFFGLMLLGACAAIGLVDGTRGFEIGPSVALVLMYAVACRVRFHVGAGYTVPTQLIFVPMLFVLPPAFVPLAVAIGSTLSRAVDVAKGESHPDRLLLEVGNAWHAVGPAIVFAIANPGAADWGDGGIYAVAFAAQVAMDSMLSPLRDWLALGVPPALHLRVIARIAMIDALLSPIGLAIMIAAVRSEYRTLVALPLLAVFAIFAQEREANIENALQLSSAYRGTALLLGDVLEDKDAYTASHSHGVVSLSLMVADALKLDPAARRRVEFGALLHDIGKIAVPAEIINKPGPLDDEEWAVMKLHTVEGQQMLDRVGGVLGEVGRVVRSSHEHYDGSGYPDGLAGEAIPIEARVVTCCDAFSAMTTTRSYRKAMSLEAAREELIRNSGTQFDPRVVDALLEIVRDEDVVVSPPGLDAGSPAPAHSAS